MTMAKKVWRKPEVKHIAAGSAETGNHTQVSDATGAGNTKS
jgi:hypothetical protein